MNRNLRVKFNVGRAVSVIITLFDYKRKRHVMTSQRLLAFLYICDRREMTRWAHPMIGDEYISTPDGPALKSVKQLIEGDRDELNPKVVDYWDRYIVSSAKGSSGYVVEMRNPETIFIDHHNRGNIVSRDPLVIEKSIVGNHTSLSTQFTINKIVVEDSHRKDPKHAPAPYNSMAPRPEGITDPALMRAFPEWKKHGGTIELWAILEAVGWSWDETNNIISDIAAHQHVDAILSEDMF